MSINLLNSKIKLNKEKKKLSVQLTGNATVSSHSENSTKHPMLQAKRSNDGQCLSRDSSSTSDASVDHKEGSVQQNSNRLPGMLQTLTLL